MRISIPTAVSATTPSVILAGQPAAWVITLPARNGMQPHIMHLQQRHGGDMHGMGDMGNSHDAANIPLSAEGVDFSNTTQAAEFLEDLLNDDQLKVIGNAYARYFWFGIIAVVGLAASMRLMRWFILKSRLQQAARELKSPAKPKSLPSRWFATVTAMGREATYLQFSPTMASLPFLRIPPLGTIILIFCYLSYVLALEFVDNNIPGAQYWQALGVRAGWLAVAQLPLMVLLVNKNNVIGLLTGTSYERLNVLHRWSARIMLLMAIFHFAFQSTGWQKYGLVELEWATDDCPTTGIAAFAILLWMNITTVAPLRYLSYEVFVLQHIVSWIGFVIAIMMHLPSTALSSRVWVYIPIGLYLSDRVIRTVLLAWKNRAVSRATLLQLAGGVTKLKITNKTIKSWSPGAHMLLSVPQFGFLQSHPATIVSTPKSHGGDLVFILKGHKGFTKRIMDGANGSTTALIPETKEDLESNTQVDNHIAFIDGPYGASQSDFAAFDSICLISGSTGVTFTMAILQDIADRATTGSKRLPLRRIHFVWCIKDTSWASWINNELSAVHGTLVTAGIDLKLSIYVTCSDHFTNRGVTKDCPCECDKSKGPCCCVQVDEDEKGEAIDALKPVSSLKGERQVVSTVSSLSLDTTAGRKMPILPCAIFHSGRPDVRELLTTLLDAAGGESGVAVCGPAGLSQCVRNAVVGLSDERAIHKGTGAQGCYLHVEAGS